jgi:hypothetical protein
MIWVACEQKCDSDDGQSYETVHVPPLLGADNPTARTLRVEYNPKRNRNLGSGLAGYAPRKEGYCVSLKYRDAYLKDGSAINTSIEGSVRGSGTTLHQYRGPMVAVRELPFECYGDITLADFRHLIDYVTSYGSVDIRESSRESKFRAPTAIRGAKICCHGEIALHSSDSIVSVEVPRATRITYRASGRGVLSSISKCLGIPLRL